MVPSYVLKPNVLTNVDEAHDASTGGAYFQVQSGGNSVILAIRPTMDGTITVCPGDGIFAGGELNADVYENQMCFIHLETGPYLITKGKNRGCIYAECDCEAELCMIELA